MAKKMIKGYTPLNRPGGRDERSPSPAVSKRQQRLEQIFLEERDPMRKKERYDALMVKQDDKAIANLPEKEELRYFRDVRTLLYSPYENDNVVIDHDGDAD